MNAVSYPIPTPRKDAVGLLIDQHRAGCQECTHGVGCRTGWRLWRRFLAAWDQDYDVAHAGRSDQ